MTISAYSVPPKVYVVLVNWNGWQHTLECLESLFRSDFRNFEIVVIDNASADGSADRIHTWARGEQLSPTAANPEMARYSQPPVPKPIPFSRLSLAQAKATAVFSASGTPALVLIDAGSNLGFGGGNN